MQLTKHGNEVSYGRTGASYRNINRSGTGLRNVAPNIVRIGLSKPLMKSALNTYQS
jgi:hypothetical protein